MKIHSTFNEKGITLIELLVALAISAIVLAGVYQLFISQTRSYAKQDQVVEVQQSVRSAMEILLRDLRMTGFDDDNPSSKYTDLTSIAVATPIVTPVQANSITVSYEYFDRTVGTSGEYQLHSVAYAVNGSNLVRTRTVTKPNKTTSTTSEILLPNVFALTFTYGVDRNNDGVMDDQNADTIITDADYVAAGAVAASTKVVAIRVVLTGRPDPNNQDISKVVSPRTLASAVTLRNLCLR
jgi:prepilin-type N-terminal cleavage/methylation domain-containing protein